MAYAFTPPPQVTLPVVSGKPFPVRRIFCVARNYADHAREMGSDPVRDAPFFFMKPTDAILQNHSTLPYPPATANVEWTLDIAAGAISVTASGQPQLAGTVHVPGLGADAMIVRDRNGIAQIDRKSVV